MPMLFPNPSSPFSFTHSLKSRHTLARKMEIHVLNDKWKHALHYKIEVLKTGGHSFKVPDKGGIIWFKIYLKPSCKTCAESPCQVPLSDALAWKGESGLWFCCKLNIGWQRCSVFNTFQDIFKIRILELLRGCFQESLETNSNPGEAAVNRFWSPT